VSSTVEKPHLENVQNRPICPFCGSEQVTLKSPFGRAQLVRQYYCHTCRSLFERIRW
jgi:transposase-like protein